MNKLLNNIRQFLKAEDGPTAVEYAVMLSVIIVVCLVAVKSVGANEKIALPAVAPQIAGPGT
jgi:pilus assembly protein Flp/PilA